MIDDDAKRTGPYAWRRHVRQATDDTMRRLGQDALTETSPQRLAKLLGCFVQRAFPFGLEHLLPLASHSDERVSLAARIILAQYRAPEVRAKALKLLEDPDEAYVGAMLLERNYDTVDAPLLVRLAQEDRDTHEYHQLATKIRSVVKRNLPVEAVPALLAIYENGYCAMCRASVVDLLIELRAVPDWMIVECRHDSETDTRKAIAAYAAGK
jgi:hypothetical protein